MVSGNRTNETRYYEDVLSPLVQSLYSLVPTVAFQNNSVYLRIYSKDLVLFKHSRLGLPIGPKDILRIPSAVTQDRVCKANVLSGLYDTDGCVKIRHDRSGDYPRISFTQKCQGLVAEVKAFLAHFEITSTMYRGDYLDLRSGNMETRWSLDINGFRNFDLFVDEIGTRNPYVRGRMRLVDEIR